MSDYSAFCLKILPLYKNEIIGKRVKSRPLPFSKIIPIAQPNRGLETVMLPWVVITVL